MPLTATLLPCCQRHDAICLDALLAAADAFITPCYITLAAAAIVAEARMIDAMPPPPYYALRCRCLRRCHVMACCAMLLIIFFFFAFATIIVDADAFC